MVRLVVAVARTTIGWRREVRQRIFARSLTNTAGLERVAQRDTGGEGTYNSDEKRDQC